MLFEMIKTNEGLLLADERLNLPWQKFKNGDLYEVEIKRCRNPQFHRKVFAFFNFCFQHWRADKTELALMDEKAQFDEFRKNLTILAGYFDKVYTLRGELRMRAKSLSFASMEQMEFEQCYIALINAALAHVFAHTRDGKIIAQLYDFF